MHVGECSRGLDGRLVLLRQRVPVVEVDFDFQRRARLPPPWVVVEQLGTELVEAQDEVVGRADELSGVDGACLDRGEDLSTGNRDLLATQIVEYSAADAGNAHRQALEVSNRVDLLGEPTTHLTAGGSCREENHVVLFPVEVLEHLNAAALVEPGVLLALVQAERHRGTELLHLADPHVVVGGRVAHLHALVSHRGQHLAAGDDLTGRAGVDLELASGKSRNRIGEDRS